MTLLSEDICELIQQCFKEKIENFDIKLNEGNKKGEGYIGEIIFASLENKLNGKEDHLVIKKVFNSEIEKTREFLSSSYLNEIFFYNDVWPNLKKFQNTFPEVTPVDVAAKCYGTSSVKGSEKVILENLKFKGYEIHPKRTPLSKELFEDIFALYGKYHATSFAFKHYHPEEFHKLASNLKNNWCGFQETELCITAIKHSFGGVKMILEFTKEEDILRKMAPYIENGRKIFSDSLNYEGPNSVIIHGDCWSNNMMFKYNDKKQLEDIKLIDFQMSRASTPVFDLTYTFYSGAGPEELKNWEHFLKVYYNSLKLSLQQYNLDVDKIYPYETLKAEWKDYIQFGFIMGIMIWGAKFVEEDEIIDLDVTENKEERTSLKAKEQYAFHVLALIEHFYLNNFLIES
ncbi:unnamed protein product [Diabrotica balteata]|uniref:CHK kinase-like domain-containing protein n=1 Tax=Diabrotica balteata TaxID=107213 RepID=A0A9N9T6R8_DIABA|nr:unnamed protein product [Diabrotica balteata]